jgi:hypothetical protein
MAYSRRIYGRQTHNLRARRPWYAAVHTQQPPESQPAIVGDPDDLEGLAWESGYKLGGIKDYLNSDQPVLGLRA